MRETNTENFLKEIDELKTTVRDLQAQLATLTEKNQHSEAQCAEYKQAINSVHWGLENGWLSIIKSDNLPNIGEFKKILWTLVQYPAGEEMLHKMRYYEAENNLLKQELAENCDFVRLGRALKQIRAAGWETTALEYNRPSCCCYIRAGEELITSMPFDWRKTGGGHHVTFGINFADAAEQAAKWIAMQKEENANELLV